LLACRSLETRVQRRESEFEQLKMERETTVSALKSENDNEKGRHDREMSQVQKDHEMGRDSDRKRYNELEERYGKEQGEVEKLRDTLKALDEDRRTLSGDKDTLKQAVDNKASLLESVRADAKAKKERIEELVKVVSTMESDRKDMEASMQEQKAELARAKKRVDCLDEELKAAHSDKDYTEGQQDKYKRAYEEVARTLSATDVQVRSPFL
jgi:chromosome segregation ATPase